MMNGTHNAPIRNYLIRLFSLLLLCLGIVEIIRNTFFSIWVRPRLYEVLQLSALHRSGSFFEAVQVVFQSLLYSVLTARGTDVASIPSFLLEILFQVPEGRILERELSQNAIGFTGLEQILYQICLLAILVVLFIIWILPYFIAGIVCVVKVNQKVKVFNQEQIEKEKVYEKQRNLMLSDIAHDLKTPMTSIVGYAKILSEESGLTSEERASYAKKVYQKSLAMNELLILLFEYVKLNSAGYTLNQKRTDIVELMRSCVAEQYSLIEERDMVLDLMLPEEEIYMNLDGLQISRAINNLILNGIHHNKPGAMLQIKLVQRISDIEIWIADSGEKIAPALEQEIFQPFVQADPSRHKPTGSGLGLSITKKIVEMHGGSLTLLQENLEEYTKAFVIRLPNLILA